MAKKEAEEKQNGRSRSLSRWETVGVRARRQHNRDPADALNLLFLRGEPSSSLNRQAIREAR